MEAIVYVFSGQIEAIVYIFFNISEGTALLLQGVTENDSSLKRYIFKKKIWEIRCD